LASHGILFMLQCKKENLFPLVYTAVSSEPVYIHVLCAYCLGSEVLVGICTTMMPYLTAVYANLVAPLLWPLRFSFFP
jgi:hypothetical protein